LSRHTNLVNVGVVAVSGGIAPEAQAYLVIEAVARDDDFVVKELALI
jgi:hypothetical protein